MIRTNNFDMSTKFFQVIGRIRRTSITNSDENQDAFDEYKAIRAEIKREHPDLTPSALQQMAVERFSKRCSQRDQLSEVMRGMSTFQFGLANAVRRRSSKDEAASTPVASSDNENLEYRRHRSLNPRTSVTDKDIKNAVRQSFLSGVSSHDEDSLDDSLRQIELEIVGRRRSSRRSSRRRSGARASLSRSVKLVDVKENENLHASIGSIRNSFAQSHQEDSNSARNEAKDRQGSISELLPDEIKAFLDAASQFGEYNIDESQRSLGLDNRSEGRRISRINRISSRSSFGSFDSGNFEGDFSAWGSTNSV